VAFHQLKKKKKWIFKAIDRRTRRTIAYVIGNRDIATFKRLYDKVKHLKKCKFYTDCWEGFVSVLPKKRHIAGKKYTVSIEQNNSDTRHYLGRMTRRTKIVSKSEKMIDLAMKLWIVIVEFQNYEALSEVFLSIFK
jgi:insertion element IS1 protein InsB